MPVVVPYVQTVRDAIQRICRLEFRIVTCHQNASGNIPFDFQYIFHIQERVVSVYIDLRPLPIAADRIALPFAVQQKSRSGRKKFAILIKHRRIHDIPSHFFECDASVPLDFPPLYGNPIRYAEYAQIAITSVFRFFFCDFNISKCGKLWCFLLRSSSNTCNLF